MRARTLIALVLGLSVLVGVGADAQNLEPINALPSAPNVFSTDLVPIFQNGTTKSATVGQVVGGTAPIQVPIGGTGLGFLAPNTVLVGEGNSPINQVGPGVAGQVLMSSGPGLDPVWTNIGGGTGTVTSVGLTMPAVFAVAGSPVSTTGTLAVTANGTSGGVPFFDTATTLASSGALALKAPVLGGGPGVAPFTGARSGNTTTFGTTSGTLTNGHCVSIDGSGNFVDAGGACTIGGGGGTVNAGTAGQMAYYATSTNAVSGNPNATISNGALTLGVANTTLGTLTLEGSTSGSATIQVAAAAGTPNALTLPTATGSSGQLLSTNGGSPQQLSWVSPANQTITLSGDTTGSGTTAITTTTGKVNGVSYPSGPSTDTVPVVTASNTATYESVPNCTDSAGNHLNYATSSHTFTCGASASVSGTVTSIATTSPITGGTITSTGTIGCATCATLNTADQTLSGGFNVTSLNLGTVSSGTTTIDCGARPLQYLTDNGAFTLAAPTNDGSCDVLVTNGASAGTITFSGFSVGSNTGDGLDTTNTHKFTLGIWRINGTAGYRVAAHQ